MSTTMIEQLAQTARRIQRETSDEQSQAYDFAPGFEEYAATLRRLPFTCPLWAAFRRYAEARAVYEAAVEQQQRWRGELQQLRLYLHDVMEDPHRDPDTIDFAAYVQAEAKAKVLARRVQDPHGIIAEYKDVLQRANESWGQLWSTYLEQKRQEAMIGGADFVPSVPGYNLKAETLHAIRERIRAYEAPREVPA